MKITKNYLKQIIKEELQKLVEEEDNNYKYLTFVISPEQQRPFIEEFFSDREEALEYVKDRKQDLKKLQKIKLYKQIKDTDETSGEPYLLVGINDYHPETWDHKFIGFFEEIKDALEKKASLETNSDEEDFETNSDEEDFEIDPDEEDFPSWNYYIYKYEPLTNLRSINSAGEQNFVSNNTATSPRPTLRVVKEKQNKV